MPSLTAANLWVCSSLNNNRHSADADALYPEFGVSEAGNAAATTEQESSSSSSSSSSSLNFYKPPPGVSVSPLRAKMMESCLAGKPERVGPVEVDDIRRDLLGEFDAVPPQDCVQAQSENLQVFLRVRPFTAAESSSGESQECVTIEGPDTVVLKAPRSCQSNRQSEKSLPQTAQRFSFTQVFGPEAGQRKVFEGSLRGSVRDVLEGGNCLVFTYGVTNAGKTFTFLGPDHDSGLLPRSLSLIFNSIEGRLYGRYLRWVQVNSSDEAYRVMKIGKKNQSFSSTKLNQLSSRSHSIFSIRILRVDDVGVPRVLGISELALCDLAGSERCSRTHNTGERLKEAGNINSSLLALGKCISAMRLNQHAKFQHHVPFRESKLTHFLQFFFCGAGRVSMVVNINQSASCFDETLNVLKFSALAQKVVLVNTRPVALDDAPHRSAMELSMVIDDADQRRNVSGRGRKSSLVAWETTLEDVLEDEDGEEWYEEEEEEESVMEGTVLEAGGEEDQTMEEKSDREAALRLVLEAQIREEVSTEFMELFNKMEKDYSDRLEKEREILEERAEKRVEILKNLVSRTVDLSTGSAHSSKEEQVTLLEGIIGSMTEDLEKIREDAQSVQSCLSLHTQTAELEALRLEKQQSHDQLQEAKETVEQQRLKLSELMDICRQKDDVINRLQAAMDRNVEDATRDRALVESIRVELLELQQSCCCLREGGGQVVEEGSRKRHRKNVDDEERGAPAKKRVVLEEEIWRLQEENDKKEDTILQLREREEEVERERRRLEEELRRREEEVEEVKKEQGLLDQKVQQLTDLDECPNCVSVMSSLEAEQRETSRLMKENKALVNGIFQLQTEVSSVQTQLREKTDRSDSLSEQLTTTETRLQQLQSQSEEKTKTISYLTEEVENLRHRAQKEEGPSIFHVAMAQLKTESEAALQRSAEKSEQIKELQRELTDSHNRCVQLTEEVANQKAEFYRLRVELESEGGDLRRRLEEMERSEEERRTEEEREKQGEEEEAEPGLFFCGAMTTGKQEVMWGVHRVLTEKEALVTETHGQIEVLQRGEEEEEEEEEEEKEEEEDDDVWCLLPLSELECLKEVLQNRGEEEEKENRQEEKVSVVEELKQEMQRLQERRGRRPRGQGEEGRSQEFEAVKREMEKIQRLKEERENNTQDLVFSENKRNRVRGNKQEKRDGALQKIGELLHSSPSILGSKAKTIIGLVSGHSVEKETFTMATKPRRGRKKLYKTDTSTPLLDSPLTTGGAVEVEKESDHVTIKRQLRSKTCRK
ncbi:hypothetical protein INR49_020708 [Caranx melampygus]|nr:hypothetical protein INR49_020708 [Caranx melampygus]